MRHVPWGTLLPVCAVTLVAALVAAWNWDWLGTNSAQIQAIVAVGLLAVTVSILLVYRGQEHIMSKQEKVMTKQADIAAEQTGIQRLLAWLEHSPIMCAEFGAAYDGAANQIGLKNGGRGAAHNIRGHVWVVTGFSSSEVGVLESVADPTYLGPGDSGNASADLGELSALRAPNSGIPPRLGDRWVLHYGDVIGGTWHTTSNIADDGSYAPLGYFRSWSPHDWDQLTEETRNLCQVCPADAHLNDAIQA